jgi:two-component system, cell cycle sensor histidine kinase and response regulator CckA
MAEQESPGRPAARRQPASEQAEFRREILERIGAGVAIVDPGTRTIEWVNPAAAELLGAPADVIVGQRCHCFLCPTEEGNCPILDHGKDVDNAERVLRCHDGRELTVMKSAKRILIDGQVKLVETFVDLSERRKAEAARRESEDRYRVLFETSRDAMMVLALPASHFISANAATLELFGVKDEATFTTLTPWNLSPALQPDGRPSADKAHEMIGIAMREGSHGFEWRHRTLDGREFPASVLLTRLEFSGHSLVQATVRDLTSTELAMSALRNSEERLRFAVEATGMGTYLWDHKTGEADYSPEFLALYDLPPGGTLALGPDLAPGVVFDEDRPAYVAALAAANEPSGDGVFKAEFRIRRPDGSLRWLMARGRTEFVGEAGMRRPSRAAGTIMDISDRKRAEALAAVRLRLQEFAAGHSLEDLLRTTVDEVENLTSSLVGFYHFVEPDQQTLSLQAWSTRTVEKFCQAEGKGRHYNVDQAGVWVDCIRERRPVIHNDYASLPHKRGLPEGHASLVRELVVPILRNNRIVAILGVGNKASDYTQEDIFGVTYLADVAWEIAQRKRAEEDLREREEALDKIFNSSTNAMAFTSPDSAKILNVNDTWVRYSGISRSDAIGKAALELGLWRTKQERDAAIAVLEREGRLREFEATLVFRGVERQFAINAEYLDMRGKRFHLWEFRDITERKRMESELRESESRFRTLIQDSPLAIVLTRGVETLYVNKMFEKVFALTSAESLVGQSIMACVAPECRAEILERIRQRASGTPMVSEYEITGLRSDGSKLPIRVVVALVQLPDGEATLFFITDLTKHKLAEEIARASEELHRSILHTAMDGFSLMDAEGRILEVNDAYCRMTGYDRQALIGMHISDLEADESHAEAIAHVRKVLTDGEDRYETRHRRKDGTLFDVEICVQYRPVQGGRLVTFLRDISERKRADQEIALLKHSIDVHFDAAYWIDSDGKIIYINDAGYKVLGFEPGALIGKTLDEVNRAATPERMKRVWDILRTRGFFQNESIHRRKDGSEFPVEILTSYVRFLGKEYACGFARDITERKQAEVALRESEEKFRASFMTGLDAIYWATLKDGLILEINPVFERVFGYSRDEAIGKTSLDLGLYCDPADRAKMVDGLQAKGFVRDLEIRCRRKDGRIITISLSVSKVLKSDQQFIYGVIRDITERKLAEEETARLTSQLQQAQKMESVGRLAGGVAHDFNNMLGVILGHSELALEKVNASDSLHNDLVSIRSAAQRSADLTRQLLAFARKQTVAPKVLNLNDTLAGMLKMVKRLIGEDVELEWRPGENLWPVKIDPSQIDQILANLCVNARDAIANIGKIAIKTGSTTIAPGGVSTPMGAAPGDYVWLAVSDDGCGMDQKTLSHVFEPFFTTKEVGKGTGLGLATVYGIVKQNDGFIDLRSEPGQGTVFTVYLPRHLGKDVHERPDGFAGTIQPGQETILLVEDEAPLLDVTQRMLAKRGYRVLAAKSPGQAMQLAREHAGNIDLLVTDVVMPEMNGRDLAKNFLSLYPKAKRLFMSGYTADVIAHQGVLDDGVFFIQKPFSAKDLAAMVRKVLEGGREEGA